MTVEELIAKLKEMPPDAIVGAPYGLGSNFKSITRLSSHAAHIMENEKILGKTTLVHLHND